MGFFGGNLRLWIAQQQACHILQDGKRRLPAGIVPERSLEADQGLKSLSQVQPLVDL